MMYWVENDCSEIRWKLPTERIPEEKYQFILENMPICCVDVVIEHGGKFLVCKRKEEPAKDYWWFIGGRLLKGEETLQCARRKVNEEVGITWKKMFRLSKIDVFETIFNSGPFGAKSHTINITYNLQIVEMEDININKKYFSDYQWVTGNEEFLNDYVKYVIGKSRETTAGNV